MVHKLYKPYARPLARVVTGLPISWEPTLATAKHENFARMAAWSPCSRFIAVGFLTSIEIRDAVTLGRLHTFTHPRLELGQKFSFSPDSRSLTQFSHGHGLTTWDLQTGGRISVIPDTSSWYISSAYSMDGKVVAAAGLSSLGNSTFTVISTYNLLSGTRIYTYTSEEHIVAPIWTRGEFLRFATETTVHHNTGDQVYFETRAGRDRVFACPGRHWFRRMCLSS